MEQLFDINIEFASKEQVYYAHGLEKKLLPKWKRTSIPKLKRMSKSYLNEYISYMVRESKNMNLEEELV